MIATCSAQVFKRGNLALLNSCCLGVPIRVIRGNADTKSYTGNIFIYDGLYRVSGPC